MSALTVGSVRGKMTCASGESFFNRFARPAHSSSGLGHRPLKAKITGPRMETIAPHAIRHEHDPRRINAGGFQLMAGGLAGHDTKVGFGREGKIYDLRSNALPTDALKSDLISLRSKLAMLPLGIANVRSKKLLNYEDMSVAADIV